MTAEPTPSAPHHSDCEVQGPSRLCGCPTPSAPTRCEKHQREDCDFRGPCGDAAFLAPIVEALAEPTPDVEDGYSVEPWPEMDALHRASAPSAEREIINQLLALDPADHATKSRDYGRGFAECLRIVHGIIQGTERVEKVHECVFVLESDECLLGCGAKVQMEFGDVTDMEPIPGDPGYTEWLAAGKPKVDP